MTTLEDQLRESLRTHASRPRLADDVAGSAIRGAAVHRRRRATLLTAAAVLAVVAAVSGVVATRPTASPPILPGTSHTTAPATTPPTDNSSTARYGVRLDVLEPGNRLRTSEGRTYDLGAGTNYGIVRVPVGWLYGENWQELKLLLPDGTSVALPGVRANEAGFEQPGVPVVSSDGTRIAWVLGTTMHAGTLTSRGVTNETTSPVPANSFAATWIGNRVVVGQTYETGCCGYNHAQHDVWDPTKGNFVPHWTKGLSPIYGPVPVGERGYALFQAGGKDCLATVDGVANMAPGTPRCLPGLTWQSLMGSRSPDGHHLVELDSSTQGGLMVIDLAGAAEPVKQNFHCVGHQPLGWEDNTSVLLLDTGSQEVRRCNVINGSSTVVGAIDGRLVTRLGV